MHARKKGEWPVPPELRLQVVDRNFAFRDCNYSLYPSWLAWPWPHAQLLIRGSQPFAIERRHRGIPGGETGAFTAPHDSAAQYREAPDAAAVFDTLQDFARNSPRPAQMRLNLNTGPELRKLSGLLAVLGCRLASVGRNGELLSLGGVEFEPPLGSEPGGPANAGGQRPRHRILIRPGTCVRFALPLHLAQAAQSRPRPGQRVEAIEPLPSVFTDSSSFRALWPQGPAPQLGRRYRIEFSAAGALPVPLEEARETAPAQEAA